MLRADTSGLWRISIYHQRISFCVAIVPVGVFAWLYFIILGIISTRCHRECHLFREVLHTDHPLGVRYCYVPGSVRLVNMLIQYCFIDVQI